MGGDVKLPSDRGTDVLDGVDIRPLARQNTAVAIASAPRPCFLGLQRYVRLDSLNDIHSNYASSLFFRRLKMTNQDNKSQPQQGGQSNSPGQQSQQPGKQEQQTPAQQPKDKPSQG